MKKILGILLVLIVLAAAIAAAGVYLARRSGGVGGGPVVVTWRLENPLLDYAPAQPLPFLGGGSRESLATAYRAVRRAREDANVRGLALYVADADFGLAKGQQIRDLLASLRQHGKFVECYLETAGEGTNGTLDYYLATACDHVALAPAADLNLLGLYADSPFLRGTLDKLKIDPEMVHVGQYKSASEIFTNKEMSAPAKEALGAVLDDLYGQIVDGIATARKLSRERVRDLVDGAPYTADEALADGLVDKLLYPDQFRAEVEKLAGGEPDLVDIAHYADSHLESLFGTSGKKIAIVFAQGDIVRGGGGLSPLSSRLLLASRPTTRLLDELADDDGISAVVLRIDSPGGSALASDLILRAVAKLDEKKPVVVSMSDVAGSGGYYIAAKARKIVAEPATITGSIGVLGGKLVTRQFQSELLGITHDSLLRGANADFYSSLEPFSPDQEARYRRLMQSVYDTFVGQVAAGRHMTEEAVAAVAAGRIWSGERARKIGLVDELGGLDRAIELARDAAKIPAATQLTLELYPKPESLFELLFREREPSLPASARALLRILRPAAALRFEMSPVELDARSAAGG